jgi:uncharacterized membrane-anchored protein YitT (DUF2179 family)
LHHRPYEDVLALLTATLFVAVGVNLFGHAGLLTGGTVGIVFLIHYATGWSFGITLFLLNCPFYLLAWKRMGREFTLKTFASVGLLSVFVGTLPDMLEFKSLSTPFASVLGGLLMGVGILMLFRHRASLGGFNVLALYLQERLGWRAGKIQMALDCAIVACSFAVVDWPHVALSVLGAVVLNLTLALNHQPGRYLTL